MQPQQQTLKVTITYTKVMAQIQQTLLRLLLRQLQRRRRQRQQQEEEEVEVTGKMLAPQEPLEQDMVDIELKDSDMVMEAQLPPQQPGQLEVA